MNRRGQRHSGFTLIETLAAGLILAVSAAAIGLTTRSALRSLSLARDFQQAGGLLDRTLRKIDVVGPAAVKTLGPAEGSFEAPDDRFRWQADIAARTEGSLYEVTVTVSWLTSWGDERSVQAQTLLNDPREADEADVQWGDL